MKKLKVKVLKDLFQVVVCYAKAGETLEVVECTQNTTKVLDSQGMTRTIYADINNLITKGTLEIKTFKF
jgi:hypothetical protein